MIIVQPRDVLGLPATCRCLGSSGRIALSAWGVTSGAADAAVEVNALSLEFLLFLAMAIRRIG